MKTEQDLIQKLMISKKIMDKHNQTPRSGDNIDNVNMSSPELQTFNTPKANYNIPSDVMMSESQMAQPLLSEAAIPKQGGGEMTEDRILNSKLPDEIKKLMIEHPIQQPNSTGPSLSNDLIERASQLMNNGTGNSNVLQSNPKEVSQSQSQIPNNFREVLKEVVTEVLTDSGVISESSSKSNESFSFKVGKHIFEGKVVKVRKTK
ncbi:hypothetical protein N9P74_00685 [bacterium]|nr:hypothetical protein [bacterium]MDB0072651.1 hypothetical protein [bacterium]MDB4234979.1 hypothetical protein [bacterium]MDB4352632.1 hypothetical protein [Porticoccaceae bacterium]